MSDSSHPLLLLDRDGTINAEVEYLSSPEQVSLLPGTVEGLRQAQQLGYKLAVITNQSGLAHGYFDETALAAIHNRLRELLAAEGVTLEAIYICPHAPDEGCDCRKPKPGMIEQALRELNGDRSRSLMVGDKPADIEAGKAAGIKAVLVRTGYGHLHEAKLRGVADAVIDDLADLTPLL